MNKMKRNRSQIAFGFFILCLIIVTLFMIARLIPNLSGEPAPGISSGSKDETQSKTPYPNSPYKATLAPKISPTRTPTEISTHTYYNLIPAITIGATQISPLVSTPYDNDNEFLYKEVVVTLALDLPTSNPAIAYLNLDDLEKNGMLTSDIEVRASSGSGTFFEAFPANNAKNYPDPQNLNFESCADHLSEFGNYPYPNFVEVPYCYLTDQGRIAIVQYVPHSTGYDEKGVAYISLKITVYKQKPNQ